MKSKRLWVVLVAFVGLVVYVGNVLATPITNPSLNQSSIRAIVINFQVGNQQGAPASWRDGAIRVTMSDRIRLRNL